jgi:ribose transport system permease protein
MSQTEGTPAAAPPGAAGGAGTWRGALARGSSAPLSALLQAVRLGPFLMLIAIGIGIAAMTPLFLTSANLFNVGLAASVVAILAVGQLFVIMTAGIDLSVGSLIALTSVSAALLVVDTGVPGWLMIPLMILVGAIAGGVSGTLYVKGRIPHPFLPTLAMLMAARGLALLFTGGQPITGLPEEVRWIGSGRIGPVPASVLLVIVVVAIAYVALNKLKWGAWVRAIGGNKEAARRVGIPVDGVLISVYVVSGASAGIAAIIVAGQTNSAYPTAGLNLELQAIAAVIIGGASFFGGRGSVLGALVGALILAMIQNGLNLLNVDSSWQFIALGVVIVLAVELDVLRGSLERRLKVARTEESESRR